MHLDHTLAASSLASFDVLTYDADLLISPFSDLQFIAKCAALQPDAIVLSSWSDAPRHPTIQAIRFVRSELSIPVAAIWWDTCSEAFWIGLAPRMDEMDVHVVVDNPSLQFMNLRDPYFNRILVLWPPQDETLFKPGAARDIPVSFLGQASSYRSYRKEVIDYLLGLKIPGHYSTQERGSQVTHEVYASLMGRSKISINLSYSVSCHQLKSRVLEAMLSGALLFESENEQTSKLFTPMKDYVQFSSKEDLAVKIVYYLEHENELKEIAEHGRASAMNQFNSSRFWQLMLAKLNDSVPSSLGSMASEKHPVQPVAGKLRTIGKVSGH